MKHHILVKFKKDVVKNDSFYEGILNLFNNLVNIDGINSVSLHKNCVDRTNRYDLLILIDMDKSALNVYDDSIYHKKWKTDYQDLIESKAIFDCE